MRGKWKWILLCLFAIGTLILGACGGGGGSDDKIDTKLASVAEITVDGNRSDWDNIEPLVVDKSGDGSSAFTGTDAKSISMAVSPDRSALYIMMDFYDGIPNPTFASQNTPPSQELEFGVNQGYQIHFDKDTDGNAYFFTIMIMWSDEEEWYIFNIPLPMDIADLYNMATIAVNEVIEISVPYSEIDSPKELFFKGEVTTSADLRTKEMIPDFGSKYWPKVVFP